MYRLSLFPRSGLSGTVGALTSLCDVGQRNNTHGD